MYLLKAPNGYWLYSPKISTQYSQNSIEETFDQLTKPDECWIPKESEIYYKKDGGIFKMYKKKTHEHQPERDNLILAQFPDTWDYETLKKHYPELLL